MSAGWQPFETAPRDGTWFLACVVGWVPAVVHFLPAFGVFSEHDNVPEEHEDIWGLTHWMPLPQAPES